MNNIEIKFEKDMFKLYQEVKRICKLSKTEQIYEEGRVLTMSDGKSTITINYIKNSPSLACKIVQGDYSARFHTDDINIIIQNLTSIFDSNIFYDESELNPEEDYSVSMKR